MVRFLLRWAAVATAASLVSACSGGMPHTSAPSAGSGTASEAIGVVAPQALGAPVGVRSVVHLPLRNAAALEALVAAQSTQGSSQYHHFITPLQFAQQYAPTAANLKAAAAALQGMGFQTHLTTQSVIADAPQSTVERAFNVKLRTSMANGRTVLSADRAATLPQSLRALSASVVVSPKFAAHKESARESGYATLPPPDDRYGGYSEYWFTDLKEAYSYPSVQHADGAGRTIGIVMSNSPLQSDVDLYFTHEHYTAVSGKPIPHFVLDNVDGGGPFDPNLSDEVDLDVQMSLGRSPRTAPTSSARHSGSASSSSPRRIGATPAASRSCRRSTTSSCRATRRVKPSSPPRATSARRGARACRPTRRNSSRRCSTAPSGPPMTRR